MDSPSNNSTQPWLTAITGIAAALGAVLAKKRFTRKAPPHSLAHDTALQALAAKLDSNHKEVLSAVAAQSTAIEKRLDALESAVARLDERTKILSTFGSAEPLEVKIHHNVAP